MPRLSKRYTALSRLENRRRSGLKSINTVQHRTRRQIPVIRLEEQDRDIKLP